MLRRGQEAAAAGCALGDVEEPSLAEGAAAVVAGDASAEPDESCPDDVEVPEDAVEELDVAESVE